MFMCMDKPFTINYLFRTNLFRTSHLRSNWISLTHWNPTADWASTYVLCIETIAPRLLLCSCLDSLLPISPALSTVQPIVISTNQIHHYSAIHFQFFSPDHLELLWIRTIFLHIKLTSDMANIIIYVVCVCRFIPNGCEVDIRIPESFPQESLEEFILAFAKVSSNWTNIWREFLSNNSLKLSLPPHRVRLGPIWSLWPALTTGHMNSLTLASSSLTWSAIAWEAGQTSLCPCSQSIRSSSTVVHSTDHTKSDDLCWCTGFLISA